jgi:hypothetical protein
MLVVVGLVGGTGGLAGGAGVVDNADGVGATPDLIGVGAAANDAMEIAFVGAVDPMGTVATAEGLVDLVPLG